MSGKKETAAVNAASTNDASDDLIVDLTDGPTPTSKQTPWSVRLLVFAQISMVFVLGALLKFSSQIGDLGDAVIVAGLSILLGLALHSGSQLLAH